MNGTFSFVVTIFLELVVIFHLEALVASQQVYWDHVFIDEGTSFKEFIDWEEDERILFLSPKSLQDNDHDKAYYLNCNPEIFYKELHLNKNDRDNIRKLIKNIADLDLWELFRHAKDMNELGKKINKKVHPLRFLGFICSNYDLKKKLIKIKQSPLKWNRFMHGLKKRLSLEAHKKNLLKYVPGFSQLVNRHPADVWGYIYCHDWDRFVAFLMQDF